MSELTIKNLNETKHSNAILKSIVIKIAYFVCSFMASHAKFLGSYYPFGLAIITSTGKNNFLPLVLGTTIGYFTILKTSSGFRYVATTIAIAFIYWSFSDLKKIRDNSIFRATCVFVPTLVTGVIMNSVSGYKLYGLTLAILEAIISASSTIYFKKTVTFAYKFIKKSQTKNFISENAILCLLLAITTILMGVSQIKISFLSIGSIISSLLIMIFSSCFGIFGGCLSSVIVSIMFNLPNFGIPSNFFSYTLSGTISGALINFGRYTQCLAFAIITVFSSFKNSDTIIVNLYEIVISSIIFMLIPNKILKHLKNAYISNTTVKVHNKSLVSLKNNNLGEFSEKFQNIPKNLEKSLKKLSLEKLTIDDKKEAGEKIQKIRNNLNEKFFIAKVTLDSIENFLSNQRDESRKSATYRPNVSVTQHFCENGNFCGDSYTTFEDNSGNFNLILCDGMGTGGNAFIESKIVSELIRNLSLVSMKSDNAIRLANLIFNGSSQKNESCIALDMIKIDRYNGCAKLIKAGAAPSFIKRSDQIKEIDFSSLPIGILDETNLSKSEIPIQIGDKILMVTDGVSDCGKKWILEELSNWNGHNAKNFSERITKIALNMRKNAHDDDITAIVISI